MTNYFFLQATQGKLFCTFYSPGAADNNLETILFVPPFGEEMNKSRRMIALQARAFSDMGYGVFIVDLYGCGDSEGELYEAKWDLWLDDLRVCIDWLRRYKGDRINLWGLRLGAILALNLTEKIEIDIPKIILWQPVLRGASVLMEMLRMKVAAEMLLKHDSNHPRISTKDLKQELLSGKKIELSGYEINSDIAAALERSALIEYTPINSKIIWHDVLRENIPNITLVAKSVLNKWEKNDITIYHKIIIGENYWSSGEIIECTDLIEETCDTFRSC